jgi:proteasome lid subunit RPN8/RPN11
MGVQLDAATEAAMRHHAVEAYPQEACGVLIGSFRDADVHVVRVRGTPNAAGLGRGTSFMIHPRDLMAAEDEAVGAGMEIVGFYHSHPNVPASPSERDHAESWPMYVYAIVSLLGGEVRHVSFWRKRGAGRLVEETTLRA